MRYYLLKSHVISLQIDKGKDTSDTEASIKEQLDFFNDLIHKRPSKDYKQLKSMSINEPIQSRKSPRRANTKSNPLAYLLTVFLFAEKYDDTRDKLKSLLMSINNDTYAYKNNDEQRELKHHLTVLFDTLTRLELNNMLRRTSNQMLNDEDKLDMTQMTGTIKNEIKYFIEVINK